jgi:hypothetical protein
MTSGHCYPAALAGTSPLSATTQVTGTLPKTTVSGSASGASSGASVRSNGLTRTGSSRRQRSGSDADVTRITHQRLKPSVQADVVQSKVSGCATHATTMQTNHSQYPMQNQLDQLRYLGYRGPVESKQHATWLITHMRKKGAASPKRQDGTLQLTLPLHQFQEAA